MNVSLTPEMERRIAEMVESGLYATASEVVRDSLRILFQAEEGRDRKRAKLDAAIQEGLDSIERGELYSGEEVFASMTAIIEAAAKKSA